jgi:hypothetical protein
VNVPVSFSIPVITGTAQVGFTLSGTNGTWTNSPTGYSYRWLANGVAIGGATTNTFLLTSAQIGAVITFEVTASNAGGSGAAATSTATSAVLPAVPVNSVIPVITGTTQVGDTLSGTNGTWSNSPTGYAYQWLAGGVNIAGATANTFLLTSAQIGAVITFQVTASNAGGSGSPATSTATGAVISAALNALATDWASRVVTNGGAAPSGGTVTAISDFCDALDTSGLTSLLFGVCCFVPDSLIAAITPLIVGTGHDPWTNMGPFVSGDLSVNGLKGDGSTKYLMTGLIASALSSSSFCGIAAYVATDDTGNSNEVGATDGSGESELFINNGGSDYFDCWNSSSGRIHQTLPTGFHGFHCGNQETSLGQDIYISNSTTPLYSIAHGGAVGYPPTTEYYVFSYNNNGSPGTPLSARRFSFLAIYKGTTLANVTALYNAVQALRVALGGGFV